MNDGACSRFYFIQIHFHYTFGMDSYIHFHVEASGDDDEVEAAIREVE